MDAVGEHSICFALLSVAAPGSIAHRTAAGIGTRHVERDRLRLERNLGRTIERKSGAGFGAAT